MQRSKMRKAVDALPPGLPAAILHDAMLRVKNLRTRQRLEARYRRRKS